MKRTDDVWFIYQFQETLLFSKSIMNKPEKMNLMSDVHFTLGVTKFERRG